MKKLFVSLVLFIVIGATFGFAAVKLMSLGDENNSFNRNWRQKFAANPVVRNIFSLHNYGDGKSDYLGNLYQDIVLEVDIMNTIILDRTIFDKVKQEIERVTGKSVQVIISDESVPYQAEIDGNKIDEIVGNYKNRKSSGEHAIVYVLFVARSSDSGTRLGISHNEDGMVLFNENIKDLIDGDSNLLGGYQASTILHEFGHQLGLEHNDEFGCLMNAEVESGQLRWQDPADVVTGFCGEELQQIGMNNI